MADPVQFFRKLRADMLKTTGRVPNKLRIRNSVYRGLLGHKDVLDRLRYIGGYPGEITDEMMASAKLPSKVLAQVLGFDEIEIITGTELTFDAGE